MGPWEISLTLATSTSNRPMFQRIAAAIMTEVTRGRLRPGTKLPGTRTLAQQLGVNRHTVGAAYDTLASEGWLTITPASGAYVSSRLPEQLVRSPARRSEPLTASVLDVRPPPPGPPTTAPPRLDLSSGQPDLATIPVDELSRAFRRVLRLRARELLGYRDAAGHPRLRAALAHMVSATRALPATASNVLVTAGSQMAWTVLARTLTVPGDRVAVESLGYRPAWSALRQGGASLVPVPVDGEGIDVAALARAAEDGLAAVYVTPHRQYPTTVALSAERRMRLLELAAEHRFAVIEDDYDHEFHYGSRPVPPVASLDTYGCVVYVGTLSKVFAPGLRLGFVVAPTSVIAAAARHRAIIDLHGDHVLEAAMAELLEDGVVQRHTNRLRRVYARRREMMLQSLTAELGDVLHPTPSDGGLGLWCPLTDRSTVDVEAWAAHCAAAGLGVHTGRHYAFSAPVPPALRLSFAPLKDTQIPDVIHQLARALPH